MFVDRPATLRVVPPDSATSVTASDGADFWITIGVTAEGAVADAAIAPPPSCTSPPGISRGARSRVVPTEYPTIQAAVDAANPGDVVRVQPGRYHQRVLLKSDVSLVGAGALNTILDGEGQPLSLIDFTGARNTRVEGFTLTGVGSADGCADPDDPFLCSGNWYAAAIYGEGSESPADPCADSSILVTHNVLAGNVYAMISYFHARAIVKNNIFAGNRYAYIANHMQDHALLQQNVFVDNAAIAIGSQAAYLDVIGNIIAGSAIGVWHEFIQMGRVSCNVFAGVDDPGSRVPIGAQGNITLESAFVDAANGDYRPTPALIGAAGNCLGVTLPDVVSWVSFEPGAFGGVLGRWSGP
jgi:hypothetical protein